MEWIVDIRDSFSKMPLCGGSSETLLDQDFTTLKQGGGASELIKRLRLQVGRIDVTPQEL